MCQTRATFAPERWEAPGSYPGAPVLIESYSLSDAKRVIVNIHGAYGTLYSTGMKYKAFAEALSKEPDTAVVLYQSSRKPLPPSVTCDDLSLDERRALFTDKSFDDELYDLKSVVSQCDQKLNGALSSGSSQLLLNGNSLGGLLALELARSDFDVSRIVTVGTGQYLSDEHLNGSSLRPDPLRVKKAASAFRGQVTLFWGTNDSTFSRKAVEELKRLLGNAAVTLRVLDNVDHSFSTLDGAHSPVPYKAVVAHYQETL